MGDVARRGYQAGICTKHLSHIWPGELQGHVWTWAGLRGSPVLGSAGLA